ncbi:hypothetical protein T10_9079 [Trichinella papuae]|uniref:Uncharacterized protein n=1 Tax=Trichinella papuae TaxID=268474 RepID=A0A0V1N667_9BILA|nr:hypothetical protein T10_9079 [Trichinella papuae]
MTLISLVAFIIDNVPYHLDIFILYFTAANKQLKINSTIFRYRNEENRKLSNENRGRKLRSGAIISSLFRRRLVDMQIFNRGLYITSRENFCLLNVLKSSHNVYAYVAFISMVVGVRCAVRVQWHFPCDDVP